MSETIATRLTGVWTLVSYTQQQPGNEETHPFGPKPEGFLIYTADGFVSAQLMRPGRPLFHSTDWLAGTPAEYQESGSGYIAYCGLFEVDEEKQTVTHIPSVALLPNLIHRRQLRLLALTGEKLTLRTANAPTANGALATSVLDWKKNIRSSVHGQSIEAPLRETRFSDSAGPRYCTIPIIRSTKERIKPSAAGM
jgi:Lipocalin-like domain